MEVDCFLSSRQLCDLEMLLNGAFSPLTGFLTKEDYESVLNRLRLADNQVWPMPITLDVSREFARSVEIGQKITLRDEEGVSLAILTVEEIWQPDKVVEAKQIFGTTDEAHPAVNYLFHKAGEIYIGGKVKKLQLPVHFDFANLRFTPSELKQQFQAKGWEKIVAFQTRNPMHRAHQQLTIKAALENDATVLIQPVVGMTKPGDIDYFTRVRCYEKILPSYPAGMVMLSLLPLAMRMAGPREALWHALIRKNYGCTHFIVGRDHAGPGKNSQGHPFYDPYAAQNLVSQFEGEIGIQMVPFQEMVYVKNSRQYLPINQVKDEDQISRISGTEFRRRLRNDVPIPDWFSFPELISELKRTIPTKHQQGFTIFFTGLSGAGKSTIAKALLCKLLEYGGRSVTLLDGDLVRKMLSSELGFSKQDRNLNILRIGYVASEVTKHSGIAICAPIAPYAASRRRARQMVSQYGGFVEVYVATPLTECERRDPKGLYQKARNGHIKGFTGIDDPYEVPTQAELTLDTTKTTVISQVNLILKYLNEQGYLNVALDRVDLEKDAYLAAAG